MMERLLQSFEGTVHGLWGRTCTVRHMNRPGPVRLMSRTPQCCQLERPQNA